MIILGTKIRYQEYMPDFIWKNVPNNIMIKLYENESYTFNNVARWTKKVDIFRQKKVFIPINLEKSHWVLVVIDITMKTIFFYDGYKGHGDKTYYAPFLSLTRQVLLSMIT